MSLKATGEKKRRHRINPLQALLMLTGLVCAGFAMYTMGIWPFSQAEKPLPFDGASAGGSSAALWENFRPAQSGLPEDKLFVTEERDQYEAGQLRLVIPKLDVDVLIEADIEEETLKKGPGLYTYAQLPGTGNRNVSIAGHRDIYGSHFYYVDTLTGHDNLYLVYQDVVYRYAYLDTTIVAADDWGPIYSQGFSCLTLTSCDPIGTSLNRIIVRGELAELENYSADFDFKSATE